MAALLPSGVTFNDVWYTADTGVNLKAVDVTLVLSSQGGTVNNIPASLFGMSQIREVSNAVESVSSQIVLCAPSYDRSKLYTYQPENATDATRGDPVDVSLTIRLIVKGSE